MRTPFYKDNRHCEAEARHCERSEAISESGIASGASRLRNDTTRNNFALLAMTVALTLFFAGTACANNVKVTNVVLNGTLANTSSHTIPIKFDLSQDNAFGDLADGYGTGGTFSDYIWIFVKYYVGTSYDGAGYRHAKLQQTGSDTVFTVPSDGAGAFIKASDAKAGLTLVWQYGLNVDGSDNTSVVTNTSKVNLKVFAIEMVKIPQGSFYIGDGRTSTPQGAFTAGTASTNYYQITGEGELKLGGADGNIGNNNATGMSSWPDDFNTTTQQTLLATFPKGYNSFYIMKYELTQGQYRDFLNTLSRNQQARSTGILQSDTTITNYYFNSGSDPSSTPQNRNGVRCNGTVTAYSPINFYCDLNNNGTGNEAADGEWIPMGYFTWPRTCMYADWAGLRPITELEYEKACRGPLTPVVNELAWGNTTEDYFSDLSNPGTVSEAKGPTRTNANANSYQATPDGMVRAGMFATATSTRQASGASYYGVMELSYDLAERCISVGQSAGRGFTGVAGNGTLTTDGYADVSGWPGYTAGTGKVDGNAGSGWSGGFFDNTGSSGTSNREWRNWSASSGYVELGVRLGRSA